MTAVDWRRFPSSPPRVAQDHVVEAPPLAPVTGPRAWPPLRMAALVLVSALATVVALVLAGGAYEFVAATQDAQRYPPPGQLIDIGARQLHLNCIGTGTPTVLLEAGGSVLVTSVLHTSLNSYWDTVVPLVMPGSNPLAVVLSLLAGCVSILHSRPA